MKRSAIPIAAAVLSLALVALLVYGITSRGGDNTISEEIQQGKNPTAPGATMELPNLDGGGKTSLASLRGKVVILNFWASWCGPCKDEAPLLESAWNRYKDQGVVVLGVDAQDFDVDAQRFVDRAGITYPVVRDKHGSTLGHYGVTGFPETWFIDAQGRIVGEHVAGPLTEEDLERNIKIALGQPA